MTQPRPRPSLRRYATWVSAMALAGTLVACGTPDAADDPAPTPSAQPSASPTPEVTTPAPTGPDPTPSRDDLTPSEGATTLPPEVLPTPLPTTGPADPSPGPELQATVEAATTDLAGRLGIDEGSIGVLVARAETFPDGSVGCPKPGQMVTQALVEGHRVVLQRDGRVWLYTAARGEPPTLCESDAKDGGHGFVPPPGHDE